MHDMMRKARKRQLKSFNCWLAEFKMKMTEVQASSIQCIIVDSNESKVLYITVFVDACFFAQAEGSHCKPTPSPTLCMHFEILI